jgi:hypothetical protein
LIPHEPQDASKHITLTKSVFFFNYVKPLLVKQIKLLSCVNGGLVFAHIYYLKSWWYLQTVVVTTLCTLPLTAPYLSVAQSLVKARLWRSDRRMLELQRVEPGVIRKNKQGCDAERMLNELKFATDSC